MKKNYLLFLLVLSCAFVACDNDDDVQPRLGQAPDPGFTPPPDPGTDTTPDTVSPTILLYQPTAKQSIAILSRIKIHADIQDNRKLDRMRFLLLNPTGMDRVIADIRLSEFMSTKRNTVNEFFNVPKFTSPGMYTVLLEARDMAGNVKQESVEVTLLAPDLSFAEFEKHFNLSLINANLLEALDWFGYNYYERGMTLDAPWLSVLLNLMIGLDGIYEISEEEWTRFTEDFRIEGESWASWDQDGSGWLDDDEFHAGITRINLFGEWDRNQDKLLNKEELAAGVFSRWDRNGDNVLSESEYLNNFYSYLYSKRP